MVEANGEEADEFGLFLDQPADPAIRQWRHDYLRSVLGDPARPGAEPKSQGLYSTQSVTSQAKYDPASAYRLHIPPPEIYGISSGVVGLRLFPNPRFDAKARAKWNAAKYYADDRGDPEMIRPYRVGMSCAFCHASYHPLKPPRDLDQPAVGKHLGQYRRAVSAPARRLRQPAAEEQLRLPPARQSAAGDDRHLAHRVGQHQQPERDELGVQPAAARGAVAAGIHTRSSRDRAGALPSSGGILKQNPAAGRAATRRPRRFATSCSNMSASATNCTTANDDPRRVPRILFDGADSIGAWGALARVYLNIGTNYEQWITLHDTVVGIRPQKPFTHRQRPNALGLLVRRPSCGCRRCAITSSRSRRRCRCSPPTAAKRASTGAGRRPGRPCRRNEQRRRVDLDKLARGRKVFARNCIVCHSSIQPPESRSAEHWQTASQQRPATSSGTTIPARWLSDAGLHRSGPTRRSRSRTSGSRTTSPPTIASRSISCRPTPAARWRPTP